MGSVQVARNSDLSGAMSSDKLTRKLKEVDDLVTVAETHTAPEAWAGTTMASTRHMCTSGRGSCGSNGVLVAARAPTWSPVISTSSPRTRSTARQTLDLRSRWCQVLRQVGPTGAPAWITREADWQVTGISFMDCGCRRRSSAGSSDRRPPTGVVAREEVSRRLSDRDRRDPGVRGQRRGDRGLERPAVRHLDRVPRPRRRGSARPREGALEPPPKAATAYWTSAAVSATPRCGSRSSSAPPGTRTGWTSPSG